ncbi:Ring-h2 finger protein atl13 [Thalictrum thalictroides]|uniref:RING-type E3 ubiquitin transferase n=1 Tax=Thalictrum thalictroides TaxID=46969 RepID=A0A7J6WUU9_THATH|nr:Ring-h2 finger protein atl13 [Thalictrum thalictroides]
MDWVFFQSKKLDYLSPSTQPHFLQTPPPPISFDSDSTFNKISPSVLLIIIILAIIFFISGLLHLLVRFLFRPTTRDPEDLDNVTALQGQLQQLFHLHDSGVDQSYIDTLPVFLYKAIIGLKNPFDCAVCLCEFEPDDKLRLLPQCSHAFHLECIDTWLLSHSTCPLCRGSLLPEFPYNNSCSPLVLVLESGSETSREFVSDRDAASAVIGSNTVAGTGNHVGCHGEDEFGSSRKDLSYKLKEVSGKEDIASMPVSTVGEEKVVTVKLGKFRNVDVAPPAATGEGGGGTSSNSNVDARRCFSMGSFEYVMDDNSTLQVSIRPPIRKQTSKKPSIPLTPGHRTARSECDCHSTRDGFKGFDALRSIDVQGGENSGNSIERNKKDSFSFSKIWLRTKKDKQSSVGNSSGRASSFRFALQKTEATDDFKTKDTSITSKRLFSESEAAYDFKTKDSSITSKRTYSEIDVSVWGSSTSEIGVDEEVGSSNILDPQPNMPSFARRTLFWLVGKQNKVVHSSSPNV